MPTPTNIYQHQTSNYSSVLTQSQPLYATNEPRGYLAQDYAVTQKHDYLRGYPADVGQVVYSDTYRSNVSHTPYETRQLGYLQGLDAPLLTMSDNIQSVTNRDLGLKANTNKVFRIRRIYLIFLNRWMQSSQEHWKDHQQIFICHKRCQQD